MTTDDDRIAYLAGDGSGALDDADQRDLDELKGFLSDPAMWAEPAGELEDARGRRDRRRAARSPGPRPRPASAPRPSAPAGIGGWPSAPSRLPLPSWWLPSSSCRDDGSPSETLAAVLDPTDLVPDASGQATFTRTDSGWRIELDATGLPRLDDGRFYQAWLKGDDDVLVAIGTFNEGEDVVLWAGVSPVDFPTMTITEETADGDPSSSGRRVLVGPIDEG